MPGFFDIGRAQMEENPVDYRKKREDQPIIEIFHVGARRSEEEDGRRLISH